VPSVWIALGSATAKLAMAEMSLFGIADELWEVLVSGRRPDKIAVARMRVIATECVQVVLDAMQELMHAYGSSSFADGNDMQRWFRDVEQAALHGTLIRGNARDIAGRALLGVD
jgi:alkylation response protein AidB-like acyl-CoA dehydrogenase